MNDLTPAFTGEFMLAGWRDTHNGGSTVTFWLPDSDDLEVFKGMTARKGNTAGQRFMAVLVEIQDDESIHTREAVPANPQPGGSSRSVRDYPADDGEDESRPGNALAQSLHKDGYFRNVKLWDALERAGLYDQDTHTQYIRSLPCLFAPGRRTRGIRTAWNIDCSGEVCGHHTPSASLPAAGEGEHPNKVPAWYQVPLCHAHHNNWAHGSHSSSARREEKQHLVAIAVRLMAERAEWCLKHFLGIESLNELTEEMLETFNKVMGL